MNPATKEIQNAINSFLTKYALQISFELATPTTNNSAGNADLYTNTAFLVGKNLGLNPLAIATELASKLETLSSVQNVTVAGPGFININLNSDKVMEALKSFSVGDNLNLASNKKVIIEFGQPNTHKAFHIGHLKSAINGLALANIHAYYGYQVIKANFYGDVGMHVAKTTWGVMRQGLPNDFETLSPHAKMKVVDACYAYASTEFKNNPEAEAQIKQINKTIYARQAGEVFDLYSKIKEWSLQHLNLAFKELGVEYDVQYPESSVEELGTKIVNNNPGIFKYDAGAIIFPGKDYGFTTWVMITGEGNPTYETKDLGLATQKMLDYSPDLSIVTTSVEQSDHCKAVFKMFELINPSQVGISKHVPFGWMLQNNKKFSSRMGESIKGMDVIAECIEQAAAQISESKNYDSLQKQEIATSVGIAGLKFAILAHEFHKDTNYDPKAFTRFDGFSGPYIMYSYARIKSLINNDADIKPSPEYLISLNLDIEKQLALKIMQFESVIVECVNGLSLHYLCNYLFELANLYNGYYASSQIISVSDQNTSSARLQLSETVANVLSKGLNLLGINVLEKM